MNDECLGGGSLAADVSSMTEVMAFVEGVVDSL